jgi:Transglycosylase-like domain
MALVATVLAMMLPTPAEERYVSHEAPGHPVAAADYIALSAVHTAPAHVSRTRGNRPRRDRRWRFVRPYNSKLMRIASCESGLRWHIATGNGFYGGLQFTEGTWHSVGGRGLPHWWSALEQKYRAVKVYRRRGSWADWPVCGYR